MFYLTDSTGYRAGGFNTPGNLIPAFQLFGPEHLDNVEAGVKSDFDLADVGMPDVKGRINFSGFYGFYSDIGIQTTGAYKTLNNTLQLATPTLNVGDGKIYGYEGEFTVLPTDDLSIAVNFAYNRGAYSGFLGPNKAGTGQEVIPGVEYEINPLWKFSVHGTYHLPINREYGDLSFSLDYSWTDSQVSTDAADLAPQEIIPAYDDMDMSLDWKDVWGKTGVNARLWANNVLGNHWIPGCLCAWRVIGLVGYQPAAPTMYGVTLRYEFGGE
jgi:iron complex outermembrane receptor protein